MVMNYIWIGFIVVAFIVAICKLVFLGDTGTADQPDVFSRIILSTFDSAKSGFELSLGLTGVLSMWLGLMKIGEKSGLIQYFARLASPVFSKLFPELPKDHPATGSIFMNFSANMLGLDNASTPIGLRAMQQLQELNPHKERASNSMIMFLCINTSGLTIVPIMIMMYRQQLHAANPADVFLPILLTTFITTLVAVAAVCIMQKINILQRNLLIFFLCAFGFIGGLMWLFHSLEREQVDHYSKLVANILLLCIICGFILWGFRKKLNVYETFIEGAKEGFTTAVKIIPYLIAIFLAIGMFRASGAMDFIVDFIRRGVAAIGMDTSFVEALPTMIMKPLSGNSSRGMMIDAMQTYGPDSFVGRLACVAQGSVDTTFYIVALYYGSVAIRNSRYTLPCALLADFSGSVVAIVMTYLFF